MLATESFFKADEVRKKWKAVTERAKRTKLRFVRSVHTKMTKPETSSGCSPASGYVAGTRKIIYAGMPARTTGSRQSPAARVNLTRRRGDAEDVGRTGNFGRLGTAGIVWELLGTAGKRLENLNAGRALCAIANCSLLIDNSNSPSPRP